MKHGDYRRKVLYPDRCVPIWVWRYQCKGCDMTISMLPSFVHCYRHYALAVIEQVVRKRFAGEGEGTKHATRREVEDVLGATGAPSARSIWRWCAAYAAQSRSWLTALLTVMAMVRPESDQLHAHGATHSAAPTQRVLILARQLAAWLSGIFVDVPDHSDHSDTWCGLWCWGWNAGVGRLI